MEINVFSWSNSSVSHYKSTILKKLLFNCSSSSKRNVFSWSNSNILHSRSTILRKILFHCSISVITNVFNRSNDWILYKKEIFFTKILFHYSFSAERRISYWLNKTKMAWGMNKSHQNSVQLFSFILKHISPFDCQMKDFIIKVELSQKSTSTFHLSSDQRLEFLM